MRDFFFYNVSMEESLHARLKAKMKEKGLSQRQLSLKTGISEAAICKYVSGARTPHIEIIGKIAEVLGVTSDYLLGIEKKSEPYEKIANCIKENKASLTSEEKMSLILLISEK